jgi:hypothetical protein
MSQYSVSMFPCLCVAMSPCFYVSMFPSLHVSMSSSIVPCPRPCFCVRVHYKERTTFSELQ